MKRLFKQDLRGVFDYLNRKLALCFNECLLKICFLSFFGEYLLPFIEIYIAEKNLTVEIL